MWLHHIGYNNNMRRIQRNKCILIFFPTSSSSFGCCKLSTHQQPAHLLPDYYESSVDNNSFRQQVYNISLKFKIIFKGLFDLISFNFIAIALSSSLLNTFFTYLSGRKQNKDS